MGEHTYFRVRWLHRNSYEPIDLWTELDAGRFETRKLYIFRDGEVAFASATEEVGDTALSTEPVPTLAEIAQNREFHVEEVSKAAFEERWQVRHASRVQLRPR